MKKKILLLSIGGSLSILVLSSYHGGAGASGGYDCTGAETGLSNPAGCSCHGSSATTTVLVNIELDSAGVATTHYKGGMTYTVKMTGSNSSGLTKYGFQLGSINGSAAVTTPTNTGTWSTTSLPASTQYSPAQAGNFVLNMVEQSATISTSGTFSETFTWTAPTTGTGTISFWAVLNAVNGNGGTSGDKWNITHVSIPEWVPGVSVQNVADNISINVFPNPVVNTMNIQLSNMQQGTYNLTAFDLTGRTVSNENFAVSGSEYAASINTNNWQAGIYQVVLSNDNMRKVVSIVKQ